MAVRTYEITFSADAVPAIVAAFDDFAVSVGPGIMTVRGEGMDQAALHVVVDRLQTLALSRWVRPRARNRAPTNYEREIVL
jgi:predicted tellurium resistance membrane protein TerC